MSYSEGFHQTASSPNDLQIQAETFHLHSFMTWLPSTVITMSDYMRVSHSETSNLKIPEVLKYFDLHGRPVERQPISIVTLYFLCVSYLYLPTIPVNMQSWACIVQIHQSVKFGGNIGKSWKLQGKMSYSEGFHQTARSLMDLQMQRLTFRVYSYMMGLHSAVVTTSARCGSVTAGRQI